MSHTIIPLGPQGHFSLFLWLDTCTWYERSRYHTSIHLGERYRYGCSCGITYTYSDRDIELLTVFNMEIFHISAFMRSGPIQRVVPLIWWSYNKYSHFHDNGVFSNNPSIPCFFFNLSLTQKYTNLMSVFKTLRHLFLFLLSCSMQRDTRSEFCSYGGSFPYTLMQ